MPRMRILRELHGHQGALGALLRDLLLTMDSPQREARGREERYQIREELTEDWAEDGEDGEDSEDGRVRSKLGSIHGWSHQR